MHDTGPTLPFLRREELYTRISDLNWRPGILKVFSHKKSSGSWKNPLLKPKDQVRGKNRGDEDQRM